MKLDPRAILELTGATVTIAATLWAVLRYIFGPRLENAVRRGIEPLIGRVGTLEERAGRVDDRIDGIETGQDRAESAIAKVGDQIKEGLDGLASAIKGISEAHEGTAREVAFIRGKLDPLAAEAAAAPPPFIPQPPRRKSRKSK